MSAHCYELVSLKYFQNVKLIAGKKGVNRLVTWPFICTTPTISQWLHGGELLFITGAGLDVDEVSLTSLLNECIKKDLSGVVIVIGNQYIPTISPKLIQLADQADFPLFEMPWNIKLIDITQEISEFIMQRKEEFKQSQHFLERLLFSESEASNFDELSELYSIPNKSFHFISIINIEPSEEVLETLSFIRNDIIHSLSSLCNNKSMSLVSMNSGNNIISFASADSIKYINHLLEKVNTVFRMLDTRHTQIIMRLGIGRTYTEGEISKIKTSFREAQRTIKLMKKGIHKDHILHYNDLGIYQLLFEIKKTEEIRSYYQENIGCLIENDKKNATDLLGTLRFYLYNNCNLVTTAQALFIHRNTLIYRLNTIKTLLNKDLNDSLTRLELFNSIIAYDFLEK